MKRSLFSRPMRGAFFALWFGIWCAMVLAFSSKCYAQRPFGITPNYLDADAREVAKGVGVVVDKKFIFPPGVNGTVTLFCNESLSSNAFLFVFLETLRVNGFSTRVSGDKVYVSQAAGDDPEQRAKNVFAVHHSKVAVYATSTKKWGAAKTKAMIAHLLSANSAITEYQRDDILIISDKPENIKNIRAYFGESDNTQQKTSRENQIGTDDSHQEVSYAKQGQHSRYAFFDIFNPQPVFRVDGSFTGFRLYPAIGPSKFNCLGLKAGDLLIAIDNVPLNSDPLKATEQDLEKIATKEIKVLSIERGGRNLQLENHCDAGHGYRVER